MLSTDAFFYTAALQFQKKLPFVLYNYPYSNSIEGILQSDDSLIPLSGMQQSGFVFAPFYVNHKTVFMPLEHSDTIRCEITNLIKHRQRYSFKTTAGSQANHISLVGKGVKAIEQGELKKVVLSRKQCIELPDLDCLGYYKNLVLQYPNAFCYLWYHPKVGLWMGATPETLIEVKDSYLQTMALAGTISDQGQKEVIWGDKEKHEQAMVTMAILDALKGYSEQLQVSEVKTVKAAKLYHLQTAITAKLTGDLETVVERLHPTPAVCGMPKEEALRFISENEHYDRAYYTGYLGTLNMDQQARLYVNLRCMQYADNTLSLYVGGGVTIDSVPELEWEETVSKGKTILDIF